MTPNDIRSEDAGEQKAHQDHMRTWIGRKQVEKGCVDATALERFAAVFEQMGDWDDGVGPLGLHWCVLPFNRGPVSALGPDGHPPRGDFLPPIALPRRMWAGGALEFVADIRIGDAIERHSQIKDVTFKEGKSGALAFVTVNHDVHTLRGIAIRERQDIVYRPATTGPVPITKSSMSEPVPSSNTHLVDATNTLLFWYSALTQNAHRIHYDLAYATQEEFYPGLVVHGPMQATFLMLHALKSRAAGKLERFDYRGVAPLIAGQTFSLNCKAEGSLEDALWTANHDGIPSMRATACWGQS